ncbi:GerAB/ArcD/ProY family transporter [Paenibacillus sepulcri]|uniref:Spore germination protein n=1 Tax=Paenibacillus sepulcri TaxID=359917 RepID=A0ABS7C327_9BACL|nr:spore germination protein [Paenibacillus sepulcri]
MQVKITPFQAVIFLFIYLTSSAIINIPAPLISFAGNSSWISLCISAAMGMILILPVLWLARTFPEKNFIEYSKETVGAPVAFLLGLAFLYYQIHMGAAIVLDIAMFLKSSMMRSTPSYWFIFLIFLVVAVTVDAGIDKITGLFPILIVNVMFFVSLIVLMSITNFDFNHLLPILPDGVKPLLHGIYYSFGFPFVEVVVFSMILPFVAGPRPGYVLKMLAAIGLTALSLIVTTLTTILVFGPIAGERKYSLFEVARSVSILDVFQRIEALIGYSLIVASFMKTTILLFTAHQTCIHLLGLKKDKMLVFPLALLMALISMTAIEGGEAKWNYEVTVIHPMWGMLCGAVPLLLVFFIALIRRKKKPASTLP